MLLIAEQKRSTRVDISGDLSRNNILPIKDDILESIGPETKAVEFHLEDVDNIDAPAMAMMVFTVEYLLTKRITSSVSGLTGERMDLATMLGLHLVAEVEEKFNGSGYHRGTRRKRRSVKGGK